MGQRRRGSRPRAHTRDDLPGAALEGIAFSEAGRIVETNEELALMLGLERRELIGRRVRDLVSPPCRHLLARAAEPDPPDSHGHFAIRKDGTQLPVEIRAHSIALRGRKVRVTVIRDVSARLRAEERLRREKGLSDTLIESLPGLFYMLDERGRLARWNRNLEEASGYAAEELPELDPLDFFPADERPRAVEALDRVLRDGAGQIESCLTTRAGVTLDFLLTGRRRLVDGRPHLVGVGIDTTDRRRAREEESRLRAALTRAASEWRHTFDAMEAAILILDGGWRVVRLNRSAMEQVGRPFRECLDRPLAELGSREPWSTAAGMEIEMREQHAAFRQIRNAKDGRSWDLAVTRMSDGGEDARFLLLIRDVTAVTELQESVRQAEKMVAMGTLTAGVAHEVRNPLFAISANVDALEMVLEGRDDVAELVEAVKGQVRRLRDLMVDLLELGRPATVTLAAGLVDPVVDAAVQGCKALAEQAEVRVGRRETGGPYAAMMDHGRLLQVLDNLLENAIQHSPRGGSVWVEMTGFREEERDWVRCAVLDEGSGFGLDDLSRVFEPFFSRRRGGTGLGLSIAHRIVEQHAGRLRARNREGGGAAVVVELPRVPLP
jgi:PAS domain S-box-containing protein